LQQVLFFTIYAKGQIFGGGKICPFARASQALFGRGFACRAREVFRA